MPRLRLLLAFALLASLAACGPDSTDFKAHEIVAKIPNGATEEEVLEKVGSPSETRDLGNGAKAHVYEASDRKVVVFFAGGKVTEARATDRVEFR